MARAMLEIRKLLYIALAAILTIAAVGVFYLTYRALYPSPPVLKAIYVTEAPKLDGQADPVWDKAEPVTFRVSNGVDVTMKAVYTSKRFFIQASYEGDKQGAFQTQWIYDGEKWTLGKGQDLFGIFFNKNNSIKGFNENGFDIMTVPPKAEETKTGQTGTTTTKKGKKVQRRALAVHQAWPFIVIDKPTDADLKQTGDFWEMSMGVSNVVGKGFDWRFGAWPPMPFLPTGFSDPLILEFIRAESEKTEQPFIMNKAGWDRYENPNISELPNVPAYRYKEGKNINNIPYPVMDDMVKIEDLTDFEEGDKLPYSIFVNNKENWDNPGYDIDGKAKWSRGTWTIEMGRDLRTKHDWNIVFSPKKDDTVRYYGAVLLRSQAAKPSPKKVSPGPLMILEFQPKQRQ